MAKFTKSPILTERFSQALTFAHKSHLPQVRKGDSEVPYIAHLLAVASLVLEAGGNEDEAIAALLHDVVEDVKVDPMVIHEKFGSSVSYIIFELTEDKTMPKTERKAAYANSILKMSVSALRVSVADKLHNIRCYALNPELWGEEQVDFYRQLLTNYGSRLDNLELEGVEAQLIEISLLFQQLSYL